LSVEVSAERLYGFKFKKFTKQCGEVTDNVRGKIQLTRRIWGVPPLPAVHLRD
jgi:hypothetical protein